jgi:PAS domain S-box-containing protein
VETGREFSQLLLAKELKSEILLEAIAESAIMIDSTSTIIYVNKPACNLFGYNKDELIGQNLNLLIPDKFAINHSSHTQKFFKNPTTRRMGIGLNLTAINKNNEEFPVEISLTSFQTTFGKVAMAFINNISIRKKAEDDLKKRNQELDAFAHTLAHDLNSLLNSTVGFSELLVTDEDLSVEERKYMAEKINYQTKKMSQVISEILAFASLDKEDIDLSTINMDLLAKDAVSRVSSLIDKNNAEINIVNELHQCMGFGKWLEEVWYNLISNAIKYGGNPPVIEIGSELVDDNMVKYWVKDNGLGLTEEQTELILLEPYKVKHGSIRGHGFGMSIVKRIVEKIDGEITVKSKLNEGTEFTIYLKNPI